MEPMHCDGYEYEIRVSAAESIAGGRYPFVATVTDLRQHRDGRIELFEPTFGQYHGESAEEAESRARAGMTRWIAAQRHG